MQDHDSFGQDEFLADPTFSSSLDGAPQGSLGTRTPPPARRPFPEGGEEEAGQRGELPSTSSGRLLPPGPSHSESGRLQWGGPEFGPPAGWRPSHYVVELDDANFETQVLASQIPVLVDFWAEHCVPCRRQEEALQQLGRTLFGRVRVGRLNVYRNPETTKRYQVKGVPHLLVVRQGEVLQELVGDHTLEMLLEILGKHGIE